MSILRSATETLSSVNLNYMLTGGVCIAAAGFTQTLVSYIAKNVLRAAYKHEKSGKDSIQKEEIDQKITYQTNIMSWVAASIALVGSIAMYTLVVPHKFL
jgi:hypothetical protein